MPAYNIKMTTIMTKLMIKIIIYLDNVDVVDDDDDIDDDDDFTSSGSLVLSHESQPGLSLTSHLPANHHHDDDHQDDIDKSCNCIITLLTCS